MTVWEIERREIKSFRMTVGYLLKGAGKKSPSLISKLLLRLMTVRNTIINAYLVLLSLLWTVTMQGIFGAAVLLLHEVNCYKGCLAAFCGITIAVQWMRLQDLPVLSVVGPKCTPSLIHLTLLFHKPIANLLVIVNNIL